MASSVVRPLEPGIYAPLPTFFLPDSEDIGRLSSIPRIARTRSLLIPTSIARQICRVSLPMFSV